MIDLLVDTHVFAWSLVDPDRIAPYTGAIAMLAGSIAWDHPDPFDRMIAATAIEMSLPLVSADRAFDGLDGVQGWHGRLWDRD